MDQPRFSLRQIRYFLAVAEARTISEAAVRLAISQGALTEALDELERQMAVRLFVRRRAHGVSLTRSGRELIAHARALMAAAAEFQAAAENRGSALAGRVSIGCYMTLAPFVMPALIGAFRTHHPSVELDVFYGSGEEIGQRLHEGHLDFGLVYDFNLSAATACDPLYRVRPRIVLPAEHPLAAAPEIDLAAMAGEPLVQFDVEPALSNTRRIFETLGVPLRQGLSAPSIELVRSLVGHGFGYAVLLHHPPGDLSYEGKRLAVREIAGLDFAYDVVLARSTYLRATQRSEELRRFCLSRFAGGPESATPLQAVDVSG
ncbi:LysR family transcriptional regulator [Rhizobium puerariae]|uniref:LysR family transcriptional regulator n=1 Tax=Rhizobium puerariae TaxID=1585791 RepID=A0ABV6ALR5_9HYPH